MRSHFLKLVLLVATGVAPPQDQVKPEKSQDMSAEITDHKQAITMLPSRQRISSRTSTRFSPQPGARRDRILSATIWLTDLNTFSEMNEVWYAWVEPGAPPARAAVGVPALASDDFKLEISVIAAQSTSGAS